MKQILPVVLMVLACAGCIGGSAYNVRMETEPMRVLRTLDASKMREAIVRAGQKRDWTVKSERPGCVTLLLLVRGGKHTVTVDVSYTAETFSVAYADSTNMDYVPATGEISRKYIQWVRNLKQDIWCEAGVMH